MHIQVAVENWLLGVDELPDDATVKAVDNPSILREVKLRWRARGRDPRRLITCLRYHGFAEAPAHLDFEGKQAWYRAQFFKFIDRTYLEQYAAYVDLVEEQNEYTASTTWTDAARTRHLLENGRALVAVWNEEFRGRWVTSPDGGRGIIPAGCRLVLVNGPVSNDIHVDYLRLAIQHDAVVGYHPYTRWTRWQNAQGHWITRRFDFDWQDDSGRWDQMEQKHGLKPRWAFTECGPYVGVNEGWRHPAVIGADETMLIEAMRQFFQDVVATAAYNEGRLAGWTGHWFTVGKTSWPYYELEAAQLIRIARAAREEWRPRSPAPVPPVEVNMLTEAEIKTLEAARADMRTALVKVDSVLPWWSLWPEGLLDPVRKLAMPPAAIQMYRADGSPIAGAVRRNGMDAFERRGGLLRVLNSPLAGEIWWVKAQQVQPA